MRYMFHLTFWTAILSVFFFMHALPAFTPSLELMFLETSRQALTGSVCSFAQVDGSKLLLDERYSIMLCLDAAVA